MYLNAIAQCLAYSKLSICKISVGAGLEGIIRLLGGYDEWGFEG